MRPISIFILFAISVAMTALLVVRANAQNASSTTTQNVQKDSEDSCKSLIEAAQLRTLNNEERVMLANCINGTTPPTGIIGGNNSEIRSITGDLLHGPGANNDIVGRNGWLRKRLGL